MKKLMIAAATLCAAVGLQAASCSWNTGTVYLGEDGDLLSTGDTKLYLGGTAYLFVLGTDAAAQSAYAALKDSATIYSGFNGSDKLKVGDTTYSLTKSKAFTSKGKATLADGNDYSIGSTVYAAVIVTHEGDDGIDLYSANGATASILDVGGENQSAALQWGAAGGSGAATEWTAVAVPEPFSGSLAVLGMGLLALRRKMKKAKKA